MIRKKVNNRELDNNALCDVHVCIFNTSFFENNFMSVLYENKI